MRLYFARNEQAPETRDNEVCLCPVCGDATRQEVCHFRKVHHHLRCGTCRTIHIYVLEDKALVVTVQDLNAVLCQLESGDSTLYDTKTAFQPGQRIRHSKFGTG